MRTLRIAPLILSSCIVIAATCITETRQRGPAGPWVGEFRNDSTERVRVDVYGDVLDASGKQVGWLSELTCPGTIEPGASGSFELFWTPHSDLDEPVTLPLRLGAVKLRATPTFRPWPSYGLSARAVASDPRRRVVIVELRNDSPFTYQSTTVCGNVRSNTGDLLEVGRASPLPNAIRPRETRVFPMYFNSLDGAVFEFFAAGSEAGTGIPIASSAVEFDTTRVVETGFGPVLRIAGTFTNSTGFDLNAVALSAHVGASLTTRVDAVPIGCNRFVGAGDTVPISFSIPLGRSPTDDPVIDGIEGWQEASLYRLPVNDVQMSRSTGDRWSVSATVQNDSSFEVYPIAACLALRDRHGGVLGATSRDRILLRLLPAGDSFTITGEVETLATPASAEVIVYSSAHIPRPPIPR